MHSTHLLIPRAPDKEAIDKLSPGDAAIIFTPDSKSRTPDSKVYRVHSPSPSIGTHYPISKYAIERGIHVLVTKPAVQLLEHHQDLIELARKHKVVVFVEHHKRYAFPFLALTALPLTSCKQIRPSVQRRQGACAGPGRAQLLQRVDEPAEEPARDVPRMGRQGLRHQVCSYPSYPSFPFSSSNTYARTATTSPRTTSTSTAGSCKTAPSRRA